MAEKGISQGQYKGILSGFKARLDENRLGDLLLNSGNINSIQLREALALQKASGQQLGRILLQQRVISGGSLRRALAQQVTMRLFAACFTVFFSLSGLAGIKSARAGSIKDVPVQLTQVMNAHARHYEPVKYYPALFGSQERRSTNLRPFTKWSGMFENFQQDIYNQGAGETMREWQGALEDMRHLPVKTMIQRVNDLVNRQPYITDSRNWGMTDYWANPVEFFERGGDCEDFAIAKYTSLRALGVPEERLRLAIVHDKVKNIPHAVLVVYTDEGALIMDNQIKRVHNAESLERYRPIFSINRQAWWLHTQPKSTIIASAE